MYRRGDEGFQWRGLVVIETKMLYLIFLQQTIHEHIQVMRTIAS